MSVSRFLVIVSVVLTSACAPAPDRAGSPSSLRGERTEQAAGPTAAAEDPSTSALAATTATTTAAIDRFDEDRAMFHVYQLSRQIGVRRRARHGEWLGARYIVGRFRAFGYDVKVQKFSVDSDTSRNVIASYPGLIRYPFVIGAHMDSVAGSPGANDNASGVAAMLEVARTIAGTRKARFVRFVAFGSEEYGPDGRHHVGSQVFVARRTRADRRRTPGMISVDMIADGRPLIIGSSGIARRVVARTLYRKLDRAGFGVTYQTLCDCSDNGPFERAGIPAAFMWSGPEPNYHSPSDTQANMKRRDLVRTGRAVRTFVAALDWDLIRRFRRY